MLKSSGFVASECSSYPLYRQSTLTMSLPRGCTDSSQAENGETYPRRIGEL